MNAHLIEYNAIFIAYPSSGYSVVFPDFQECTTCTENLDEAHAINMAEEVLGLFLYDMNIKNLPSPRENDLVEIFHIPVEYYVNHEGKVFINDQTIEKYKKYHVSFTILVIKFRDEYEFLSPNLSSFFESINLNEPIFSEELKIKTKIILLKKLEELYENEITSIEEDSKTVSIHKIRCLVNVSDDGTIKSGGIIELAKPNLPK